MKMRVGWLGELSSGHYMAISSMNTLQIVVSCKKSTKKDVKVEEGHNS